MAFKPASKQNVVNPSNNMKEARGWLNLEMVDKNGERHRLPKGLALYESKLEALLLKIAAENPDKEFNLVGKIYIPTDEELNIEF